MSIPARVPALTLLLAVGVALAACGGGAPDASGSPSTVATESTPPEPSAEASVEATPGTALSACELVTPEDLSAVLADLGGETITIADGEAADKPTVLDPFGTECRYSGDWGGVIVSLTPADGANLYDAARGSYADARDIETPGADGAFWSEDNHRAFFWKGSVNLMLQVGFLAVEADRADVVEAIGAAAIAKL
jgi:hypothetical protein